MNHLVKIVSTLIISWVIFKLIELFSASVIFNHEYIAAFNEPAYIIPELIVIFILTFIPLNKLSKTKEYPKYFLWFTANSFLISLVVLTTTTLVYEMASSNIINFIMILPLLMFQMLLPFVLPILLVLSIANWKIYIKSKKLS
jgi:hypothetical protein